jgi:hypothetical protein
MAKSSWRWRIGDRPTEPAPWARLSILALFAVVAALGIGWWRVGTSLSTLQARETRTAQAVATVGRSLATVKTLEARSAHLLQVTVPRSLNLAQILTEQETTPRRYGVQVLNWATSPSQDPAPSSAVANAFGSLGAAFQLHAFPINVTVSGTRQAVLRYIAAIAAGRQFATITSVQFQSETRTQTVAAIAYDIYVQG